MSVDNFLQKRKYSVQKAKLMLFWNPKSFERNLPDRQNLNPFCKYQCNDGAAAGCENVYISQIIAHIIKKNTKTNFISCGVFW
jgi:hypothetical protein